MSIPAAASGFLNEQIERVRRLKTKKRIVFPEGEDPRVIDAATRLAEQSLVEPILVGKEKSIRGIRFVTPGADKYARIYFERRRAKGVTEVEAAEIAKRPLFHSALMVAAGDADGFVGGAANT